MKLSKAKIGRTVKIINVKGSSDFVNKLFDLGFCEGDMIRIIRVAPTGDPVEIECKTVRVAIRKSDAENITVVYDK